jgi:hypothetical protein
VTLVSSIVTQAFRRSQKIAIVSSPSVAEEAEALALLNPIIGSVLGNEAGQRLHDITVGGTYDQSQFLSSWIPENTRLACSLASTRTFNLHPSPYEGQRFAVVDVPANFSTYNLTLNGNGRTIELDSSLTISEDGFYAQWMYRADTADWTRITDLIALDEMPFPNEFDIYFINRLATELDPNNGITTAPEVIASMQRHEAQLLARYRKPRPRQDMGTLGLLGGNSGGTGSGEIGLYR